MGTRQESKMKSLLFLVVLVCVASKTSALKKNMYTNLNFICDMPSDKMIRALPVDCSGFVHCSGNVAFWISCPPDHYYDGLVSCTGDKTRCPDVTANIAGVCQMQSNLTVPHPKSCAMYYDCSKTRADSVFDVYEKQCPVRMLFDSYTASCKDPKTEDVTCHAPRPVDECDYRGRCEEPSCAGLQDGNQGYHKQPFDIEYVTCLNGQVQAKHKCATGKFFDPITRRCTTTVLESSILVYCSTFPTAKFPDPFSCSLFYNCAAANASMNAKLQLHQDECKYPELFHAVDLRCDDYKNVMCGIRTEPKAPCDYAIGNCYQRQECMDCSESCVGKPDGRSAYIPPGPYQVTNEYLFCLDERTINKTKCPPGQIFDPDLGLCATEIGTNTLDLICSSNPTKVIPHPSKCSLFYDCSKLGASGNFPKYLRECFYPTVFSGTDCVIFDQVDCGVRTKPVNMCDYLQFQCVEGTKCAICPLNMPTCQDKSDGYWPLIGEEMTANYIECRGNRFIQAMKCTKGQLFDYYHKRCTNVITPQAMTTYCAMVNATKDPIKDRDSLGAVASPTHCGQYYECPQIVGGKAPLMECPYPNEFSISSKTCRTYERVDCVDRFEKLKPCEYATADPCRGAPNCQCNLPVCTGVADGFTGRINDYQYYVCKDSRTFLKDCSPKRYDDTIKRCEGTPPPEPTTEAPTTPKAPTTPEAPTTPKATPPPPKPPTTPKATPPPPQEPTTTPAPTTKAIPTPGPVGATPPPRPSDTEQKAAALFCKNNPATEAVPHSGYCNWFYNCSKVDYISECPYPHLFDSLSEICVEYSLASCAGKYKPQEMCEYDQYRRQYAICPPTGFCEECDHHHPSCVGKQDNYRGGLTVDRTQYFECRDNRTVLYQCDAGLEFDGTICSPAVAKKEEASTIMEASGFCINDKMAKIPHRDNCAKYYDCENTNNAKEKECDYPTMFDKVSKTCQLQVACGSRSEYKTPCSYSGVLALYPSCGPNAICSQCEGDFPSCVGKTDGFKGAVAEPSKYFICRDERTYVSQCTPGNVYVPRLKDCGLDLDPATGMAADVTEASKYCTVDKTAVIPNKNHCARFFACGNSLTATPMECPYPQQIDAVTKKCSMNVVCGVRPEFKKPCSYLSVLDRYTNCDPSRVCTDCEMDFPSCVGLPDLYKGDISTDPSSYYVCENERTMIKECSVIGHIFLPKNNTCGPETAIPIDPLNPTTVGVECTQHPDRVYPMEDSCARFYDCKLANNNPLGPFIDECEYPMLFDGYTGRCAPPKEARCTGRYAEIDRCEYLKIRHQYCPPAIPMPGPCVTCIVENPSCRGKRDLFIGGITINDAMFYTCLNSRTTISYCTGNEIFNADVGQCQPVVPPTTQPPPPPTTTPAPVVTTPSPLVPIIQPADIAGYCFRNPYAFAAHPDSCAMYWNCSYAVVNQAPMYYQNYLMECRYPLYFDRYIGACNPDFTKVQCGTRKEVITPCEFIAFTKALCQQLKTCAICENAQLSCRGKVDGFKDSMPQQNNQYFECRNQRTTIGTCPDGDLFDSVMARCQRPTRPTIPLLSTAVEADQPCRQNTLEKFPHAKNCARYFDCNVTNGSYGRYLSECSYPDLYDPPSRFCKDHTKVSCGTRYEPRLRCEYYAILTKYCRILGTNCPECDTYNPSCIAQNDGLRGAIPGTRTKYYTCVKERTIISECQPKYEFDMATRTCVPLPYLSSSAQAEIPCRSNPNGIYPSALSCAQYFNCSKTTYGRFGRYMMECPYPDVFSIEKRDCQDPSTTDCGQRPELKNPCEYMANMKVYTGVDCKLPSCSGKLDGRHHYPGKELQRDYMICRGSRFVGAKMCPPNHYFDPVNQDCRERLTQSAVNFYCKMYPQKMRSPNPLNCAQYIYCGPVQAQLIECGYARLFNGSNCVDPIYVTCGTRYEPIAPCDYEQNKNCPRHMPNCLPCEQRIPSCVGLQDGEVPYPGKPPSPLFVKCKNDRTISVIKCRSDLFNPVTGKCGGNFTTSYIVESCRKYPLAKFADPSWCSRYYDCSVVLRNLPNPPVSNECRYPELYRVDDNCKNIFETATTTVSCGLRYEPKDACEYLEHCGSTSYTGCPNCTNLIPSCKGRQDRQFYNYYENIYSREYFFCFKERTVLYGKCLPDQRFDVPNGVCLSNTVPYGTIVGTTTPRPRLSGP